MTHHPHTIGLLALEGILYLLVSFSCEIFLLTASPFIPHADFLQNLVQLTPPLTLWTKYMHLVSLGPDLQFPLKNLPSSYL